MAEEDLPLVWESGPGSPFDPTPSCFSQNAGNRLTATFLRQVWEEGSRQYRPGRSGLRAAVPRSPRGPRPLAPHSLLGAFRSGERSLGPAGPRSTAPGTGGEGAPRARFSDASRSCPPSTGARSHGGRSRAGRPAPTRGALLASGSTGGQGRLTAIITNEHALPSPATSTVRAWSPQVEGCGKAQPATAPGEAGKGRRLGPQREEPRKAATVPPSLQRRF